MLTGKQLSKLYPYTLEPYEIPDGAMAAASECYCAALSKLAYKPTQPIALRPSILKSAAIDILARKFFPSIYPEVDKEELYQVFHDGNVWECDYIFQLKCRGVKIIQEQVPIKFYEHLAHADIIVEIDGKRVLLELKTSNSSYFSSMFKMSSEEKRVARFGHVYRDVQYLATNFSDFRGHLSQAACYHTFIDYRVDETVIVLKEKDSSNLLFYNLTPNDIETYGGRAKRLIDVWHAVDTWEECFQYCAIPLPRKEIHARKHTGRWLVPPKFYNSPALELFYETVIDIDDKIIIVGYRLPEAAIPLVPTTLLERYDELGIYTYSDPQEVISIP